MAESAISLYRTVPSSSTLLPLIKRFCREGEGVLTSLEDLMLPTLKQYVLDQEDVTVIPFGGLVKRMLEASGQAAGLLATRAQHLAALGQAVSVLDEDSSLRKSLRFLGTREAVAKILTELRGWEVDLESSSEDHRISPGLRLKLAELSKLEKRVARLLDQIGRSLPSRQLSECFDSVLDPELMLPRAMILVGSEIPPSKVRWIRWLADQGCEVSVIAPHHPSDPHFFRQASTLRSELGCDERIVGAGNMLTERLFAESKSSAVKINAAQYLFANATSECEWAVRTAAESDSAVFVRDLESYAPLLESAARLLGIPLHIQRRVKLMENAFAQLTMACLNACSGQDVRKFHPLLRRSYLRMDKETRQFLQNAIEEARKDPSNQWEILAGSLNADAKDSLWFSKLLDLRKEVLAETNSLSWWISKLRELGDILPWQEALGDVDGYDSERDARAFNVMQSSLATEAHLENSIDSRTYTFRQFVTRCAALWQTSDVSIPAEEGVPVVNSAWALPSTKEVIVLGMLEGVFPRRRRENPILGDLERKEIAQLCADRRPLATSRDSASADREEFYAICAAPTERLLLSYPLAGEDKDNIPTFYLHRVEEALGLLEKFDLSIADAFRGEGIRTGRQGLVQGALHLQLGGLPLAKSQALPVSPSELRDALICPFKYQMRHTLNLNAGTRTAAWFRLRFLPEKAKLIAALSMDEAEAALHSALKIELDRLTSDLGDWELKLLRGGGERLILEWIKREFAARSIWPKTERIYGDRALGEAGLREMMPGEVKLAAKVAGISHLSPNSKVIHLFESRTPTSSNLEEGEQLYYGLYFLASHEPGFESVIEVDGIDGSRSLLLFDRDRLPKLTNRSQDNLKVVDLSGDRKQDNARKEFFKDVKTSMKKAVAVVRTGDVTATPGTHCQWCDYGELCRKSSVFTDFQLDSSSDD